MASTSKDKNKDEPKVTFEPLVHPMQKYFDKHLTTFSKMVRAMPHNYITVETITKYHDKHKAFPCRATDVWVTSFPKAGTTWTQELVWLLVRGLSHKDEDKTLMQRFPFFEWDALMPAKYDAAMAMLPEGNVEKRGEQWKLLDTSVNPRLIKTHLHRGMLPTGVTKEKSKIIYVMRDPRDVCISLYYHTIKLLDYTGDFHNFVDIFLNDLYEFGPFWSNVLGYWNRRNEDNILFLRYEELQQDLPGNIKKVAKFLGVTVTPEQLSVMTERLSFEFMRNNPATNNEKLMSGLTDKKISDIKFMRKGIIGDHMNHMTPEQVTQFTKWTEKWLKDSDYPHYRY